MLAGQELMPLIKLKQTINEIDRCENWYPKNKEKEWLGQNYKERKTWAKERNTERIEEVAWNKKATSERNNAKDEEGNFITEGKKRN